MSVITELLNDGIVHRLIGAGAGTIVSIAYVMPNTWRQLWRQSVVACLTGLFSAAAIQHKLGFPHDNEGMMSGAFLGAAAAWVGLAAVYRYLKGFGEK